MDPIPGNDPPRGAQAAWRERYREKREGEFPWFLPYPPEELVRLVEGGGLPPGRMLDLGSGPGVVTAYLAGLRDMVVGVDVALEALQRARERAGKDRKGVHFVVADALALPFRGEGFAFVFDRGCLQSLPPSAWGSYLQAVDDLLAPGGLLQLYCSSTKNLPPLFSLRGLAARWAWLGGRRRLLSNGLVRRLLPRMLQELRLEDVPLPMPGGRVRFLKHGIFRKRSATKNTPQPC